MTPLMRQYWDIKSLHQDKILLFRMGDFFEMFFDDAVKAAPILGIALTSRNKKSQDETPMCGVPHHSIAGPINKLLAAGLKVAMCEQIEDPKLAKGIVKRAVTRVLTPGMVYDSDTLEAKQSHYLVSWDLQSLSAMDVTTGESFVYLDLSSEEIQRLCQILPIAETVLAPGMKTSDSRLVSEHEALVSEQHPLLVGTPAVESSRRLLSYIESLTVESRSQNLRTFQVRSLRQKLELHPNTIRHLEIFSSYRGDAQGSLFAAIDKTVTSAGARLLRAWLHFPLNQKSEIEDRQQKISLWISDMGRLKQFRSALRAMGDIERRLSKISQSQCNGRDLVSLKDSVFAAVQSLEIAKDIPQEIDLSACQRLAQEIDKTLLPEPPLHVRQGHLIQTGFSPELDELIELSTNSQALLQKMEAEEKEKTGINSLKIRYNNVFGYYIEITHLHKDKVPSRYLRKQTLANAERYCTDELIELEKKVLTAQSKRADLEYEIYERLRQKVLSSASLLLGLSSLCSELDVLSGLAWLAIERNYCRPEFTEKELHLLGSRHPVVEVDSKIKFVSNEIQLLESGCLLLTGPNMAGKSTLMRQVALTAILAQMGSFVPASSARLPIYHQIFTRIGASDQLTEGLSTFMVEMQETAEMLSASSKQSLLILDEVGRGTSTFDGMSLAQAILEYILTSVGSHTFFATHYHEITRLAESFPQLHNAHMQVSEKNGEIRFLYTLLHGPATRSYGIHVAQLAGVPKSVTQRASQILAELEGAKKPAPKQEQLSFQLHPEDEALKKLKKELTELSLNKTTPLEAINKIAKWQETLS